MRSYSLVLDDVYAKVRRLEMAVLQWPSFLGFCNSRLREKGALQCNETREGVMVGVGKCVKDLYSDAMVQGRQ